MHLIANKCHILGIQVVWTWIPKRSLCIGLAALSLQCQGTESSTMVDSEGNRLYRTGKGEEVCFCLIYLFFFNNDCSLRGEEEKMLVPEVWITACEYQTPISEWKISLRYDKLSIGVSKIEKGDRMTEIITKSKVCMVGNCNISITANFGNGWDTHHEIFCLPRKSSVLCPFYSIWCRLWQIFNCIRETSVNSQGWI